MQQTETKDDEESSQIKKKHTTEQTSSNESQKKIKHSIIIKYKVRRLVITISTNCNYTQ